MRLTHWNPETDGVLSESAMRQKLQDQGYTVNRYAYPPGTYFPPHTHGVDKIDGVLSGQFEMEMQGQKVVLTAGDMLTVPRGEIHSARVLGNEAVVSLDAIKY